MILNEEFLRFIEVNLPYSPTPDQSEVISRFACFLQSDESIFCLNGYAGTGKSSLIGGVVRALHRMQIGVVLLAPTGSAARVFSSYAAMPAMTIHRKIYRSSSDPDTPLFLPAHNSHSQTIFFVDEASMIADQSSEGRFESLLDDLIEYVFEGVDCKLVLLGDAAQLPPVGEQSAPALRPDRLARYGLPVIHAALTEVVRQSEESGILRVATDLRQSLIAPTLPPLPQIVLSGSDVRAIPFDELPDCYDRCIRRGGVNETIVITRSNFSASLFNRSVRYQVFSYEEELCRGDLLVVAKNNYFALREYIGQEGYEQLTRMAFIANGECAQVVRVNRTIDRYGLRFSEVTLRLVEQKIEIDTFVCLDALHSQSPALSSVEMQRLYEAANNSIPFEATKGERRAVLRADPYLNALQVKYGYARTCHKAQGGQWRHVFVDLGALTAEAVAQSDFYRWLYTAVTRSTESLYFINLPDEFLAPTASDR